MKFLKKYWPIFVLFFLPLIYGFSYFFGDKVPFPTSYIANDIGPWNKYLPHGPVKNGIPDVPGEIFPMRSLVIDLWKEGIVPLWNPYILSGTPLLANFQSAAFFPLNFLFWLFSKIDSWSILVLVQPLLAGVFTYFFVRSLGLQKIAALLSALSFMFCGFLTVWNTYTTLGFTILFLPLILFLTEKYFQNDRKGFLPFITVFLGISFLSGHIQTWTYVFLATLVYATVRFFILRKNEKLGPLVKFLFFAFLVVPLVALQLFPTLEFYQYTGRSLAKNDSSSGIPWVYLITLLSPDFFGNPVTRNDWFGVYAEWSSYIGLTALIFALLGIVNIKKTKVFWPVFTIGVLGVTLSVSNPLLSLLSQLPLPIISNSNPARAIVMLSFSLSVLAGLGLELLSKNKKALKQLLKITLTIGLFFFLVLIFILAAGKLNLTFADNLKAISLRNFLYSCAIFTTYCVVFFTFWKKTSWRSYLLLVIVAIALFDGMRFYKKWTPFDEKRFAYPQTQIGKFMTRLTDHERFYGQFGQPFAYLNHSFSTEGYEPLNLHRYANLLSATNNGRPQNNYKLDVRLQSRDQYSKRLMDLLGVKFILMPSKELNNPFNFPILSYPKDLYPILYDDGLYAVFLNGETLPRAKLFYQYQVSDEKEIETLLNEKFDFRNIIVLNKTPAMEKQTVVGLGEAVIKNYKPNKVEVRTVSQKPALLFLNDNFYPGWEATINDKPTEIYRANYTFRSVKIPAGETSIIFNYNPLSFRIGVVLSAATLGLLTLYFLGSLRK